MINLIKFHYLVIRIAFDATKIRRIKQTLDNQKVGWIYLGIHYNDHQWVIRHKSPAIS